MSLVCRGSGVCSAGPSCIRDAHATPGSSETTGFTPEGLMSTSAAWRATTHGRSIREQTHET